MAAINTSISYQSQFANPKASSNDMRTKSGAQTQMEEVKGTDHKATSPKFRVRTVAPLADIGKHVDLRA